MEPRGVTLSLQFLAALFRVFFTHWCNQRSRPLILVHSAGHNTISPMRGRGLNSRLFFSPSSGAGFQRQLSSWLAGRPPTPP